MTKKICPRCGKKYDKKEKTPKGKQAYVHKNSPNEYLSGFISYDICVEKAIDNNRITQDAIT